MKFWGMRRRRLSREMSLSSRRGGCIRCSLKESFLPVTFEKVIFCYHIKQNSDITGLSLRRGDWGLPAGYYERGPWLVAQENRRKIEPKEIPSCLISCLLVVFIRQLEILLTSLDINNFIYLTTIIKQLLRLTFFSEDYFNSKNLICQFSLYEKVFYINCK